MRKFILFLVLLTSTVWYTNAQHLKVKHAFYAEALGNAKSFSVNYERRLYNSTQVYVFLRAGVSPGKYKYVTNTYFAPKFPAELSIAFRTYYEHMMEWGIGATPYLSQERTLNPNGTSTASGQYELNHYYALRFGYRYQPTEKGVMFRIAITPLFAGNEDDTHIENKIDAMYYGVSLGYSF